MHISIDPSFSFTVYCNSSNLSSGTEIYNMEKKIQWNFSNSDTIGPDSGVLNREVSLFQGVFKYTNVGFETDKSVMFMKVSSNPRYPR